MSWLREINDTAFSCAIYEYEGNNRVRKRDEKNMEEIYRNKSLYRIYRYLF